MALKVKAADQGDREQVGALAEQIRQVTRRTVEPAYVDLIQYNFMTTFTRLAKPSRSPLVTQAP